jgi:hypothetical protein
VLKVFQTQLRKMPFYIKTLILFQLNTLVNTQNKKVDECFFPQKNVMKFLIVDIVTKEKLAVQRLNKTAL